MNLITNKLTILILLLFLSLGAFSQKMVTDTLYIDFHPDTLLPTRGISIGSFHDNRIVNPKLVGYSSKNKYLVVPVDQEITTRKPITEELPRGFSRDTTKGKTYFFEIDHFEIITRKGRFSNMNVLNADFPVFMKTDTGRQFLGTLSYSYEYRPTEKKLEKTKVYEQTLIKWHTEFKLNMLTLASENAQINQAELQNLLPERIDKPYFMTATVGGAAGWNFWQLEAELYLTRPETKQKLFYHAGIIRYQNTPTEESFSIGRKSAHRFTRISPRVAADVSFNLLIGINRWKEPDDKRIEQILQLSASSAQCLSLEKKNQQGFILKAGLFENVYYVWDMSLKFQIGIYLSTGYKF